MPFDFADAKSLLRQTVHETLGVAALYQDDVVVVPVPVRVRYHAKPQVIGDLDNGDYAQVIENNDKIVFSITEASAIPVKRGGKVTIPKYNKVLVLHEPKERDGPDEIVWLVSE